MEALASDMYREHILDLYKNPHNFGTLKEPSHEYSSSNPLCGDEISIELKLKDKITEIKWKGRGCAISMASASLITDLVKGKNKKEILQLNKNDVLKLMMIPISPVRLKCALLALDTLQNAVRGDK